jgi:hypothetical protein
MMCSATSSHVSHNGWSMYQEDEVPHVKVNRSFKAKFCMRQEDVMMSVACVMTRHQSCVSATSAWCQVKS